MCKIQHDQADVVLWQTVCLGPVYTCIYNELSWEDVESVEYLKYFWTILGLFADTFHHIITKSDIIGFQTNA